MKKNEKVKIKKNMYMLKNIFSEEKYEINLHIFHYITYSIQQKKQLCNYCKIKIVNYLHLNLTKN